jgi:N-acetyl-gamma-glutamyl-phosphate reductase
MQKLNIGIVGGAGYTGGELLRVLVHHAQVEICFVHSTSSSGQLISSVHTDLVGDTDLVFTNSFQENIDLLFLCVGHGEAIKFLASNTISPKIKIIDLSQDFRLAATSKQGERNFVYGLPELNKTAIQKAHNIANPGCFATAIQIGLLPLAVKGLLKEVYTTGILVPRGLDKAYLIPVILVGERIISNLIKLWSINIYMKYKKV